MIESPKESCDAHGLKPGYTCIMLATAHPVDGQRYSHVNMCACKLGTHSPSVLTTHNPRVGQRKPDSQPQDDGAQASRGVL